MKKFLLFITIFLTCISDASAAERGQTTITRGKTTTTSTSARSTRTITSRTPLKTTVSARASKPISILMPRSQKPATRNSAQSNTNNRNVTVRAATNSSTANISETRTGADYEQCKSAFFTCMDQFCQLKNDSYRRCSCSDRVFEFQDISETYQKANEQLTEFSENLDVVGMTKEQATAMKTASAGEDALTEDKSASKQLLQAIMNSIKGEDSSVGGKYKNLNSINIASDISNAFGMDDSGQIIASYNGATLYKAVYPKCRNAVKEDCNNVSLQRAINAYLMAVEQDCNSVETALVKQQKELKASTHQGSAMLDLARVENHQNHNSDDVAVCLTNIESAIQSEQVCGTNYHKCLDNGQFIDVTTGAPLTGVADFYKLGELLTFKDNTNLKDQKLSSLQNNFSFVQFFENKAKKFAKDSLDKCSDDADYVWQQYLDRALLDIYYAQQAKVKEIKQSCLDLVANCYDNQNSSIASAMASLTGDSSLLLKPASITLTTELCENYINSCNSMFNNDMIKTYIANKADTDILNSCRAVAQKCFDGFGGTEYNNFYYIQSGLFAPGAAMDWFSLYENGDNTKIVSPCAKQVYETTGCKNILEDVFGGFNKYANTYSSEGPTDTTRKIRPRGIATEVYYKILDNLTTHCSGLGGYFVEYKYAEKYGYKPENFCRINSSNSTSPFYINSGSNDKFSLVYWYHFIDEEDMCPANYGASVDTQSWGMCSCWENGGYRSKNGTLQTCRPLLPTTETESDYDPMCYSEIICNENNASSAPCSQPRSASKNTNWCQQTTISTPGQICPTMNIISTNDGSLYCADNDNTIIKKVKYGVPHHKIILSEDDEE